MVEAKIVIGSNYGDEGKGLTTNWLTEQSMQEGKSCLNVLFNGGAQRGHTVDYEDGKRHVYHHLGAGTRSGADTYFDEDFMINPVIFNKEHSIVNKCFANPGCRVTTIYDMMINQIVEENRGNARHGSCGCGILETRKRYKNTEFGKTLESMRLMNQADLIKYLRDIRDKYVPRRLKELGVENISSEWEYYLKSEAGIIHFCADFEQMIEQIQISSFNYISSKYETVIFEGAQGLALDEDNLEDFPHLTPSHTTSLIPVKRINGSGHNTDTEIFYVTRSYFTRHGAGKLITECKKDDINPAIEDFTNVHNNFQGNIRYGKFDSHSFLKRTCSDYARSRCEKAGIKKNLVVTHLNYTNGDIFGNISLRELGIFFDNVYTSDNKTTMKKE